MTINYLSKINKQKFNQICKHAYENSRYYKNLYDLKGISITPNIDYKEIPCARIEDMTMFPLEFKATNTFYKVSASSGTSNNPKLMFRTYQDFLKSVQNQVDLMKICDINESDVVAILQPFGMWGYGDLTQEATRLIGGMNVPIGGINDSRALDLIIALKVTVLDISPSRLKCILEIAKKQNKIKQISLKCIMCAGEKLHNKFKQEVEQLLGTKIYNHYGSEECDALGFSYINSSNINLLMDDFFFEVVDEEGEYVSEGECGSLLVTSFYHKGTPLIRYELKDYVRLLDKKKGIIEVLGKNTDCVVLYDSVKLYAFQVELCIDEVIDKSYQYQCVVEESEKIIIVNVNIDTLYAFDIQKIRSLLEKCSIDIELLFQSKKVIFNVLESKALVYTNRGKCKLFLDKRERIDDGERNI